MRLRKETFDLVTAIVIGGAIVALYWFYWLGH